MSEKTLEVKTEEKHKKCAKAVLDLCRKELNNDIFDCFLSLSIACQSVKSVIEEHTGEKLEVQKWN